MRWLSLLTALWLAVCISAWTKEDHEIFDLVSALEAAEGKGTTFYSHLGVEPSANLETIRKAYRKKSLELHPDKNPGVKDIHKRFARLSVINSILKDHEMRERYNFFFKNGVPVWRGTGYYYSRFRPTLLHVVGFLVLLTSGAHRLVMQMNYRRDRKRVEYFERSARSAAGLGRGVRDAIAAAAAGENGGGSGRGSKAASRTGSGANTPTLEGRKRRVRVPMVEGYEGAGTLELLVDGQDVFLPHEDGTYTPLSTLATSPSWTRTWPVLLTRSALQAITDRLSPETQDRLPSWLLPKAEEEYYGEDDEDDESSANGTPTPMPSKKAKDLRRKAVRNGHNKAQQGAKDEEEEGEGEGGDGKKKKKGLGKASAMRRRKMGMKG